MNCCDFRFISVTQSDDVTEQPRFQAEAVSYYHPILSSLFPLYALTFQCDQAGCMVELLIQLAIIMVGKQSFSNIMEILVP